MAAIMVISLKEKDLKLLDKAAKEKTRTRSSYIQMLFAKYLQQNSKKIKKKEKEND
jgi:metal-responsive CopG/Arc/MetJ family transcriptional regulator